MKIKPKKGFVMVKLNKVEDETKSGIIILDQTKEPSTTGEIITVGEEVEELAPGDKVVLKPYAGKEIEVEDEQYLLLDARYILTKIR